MEAGSLGLGAIGLFQATGIFARSAADDALVALLVPAQRMEGGRILPTSLLVARSRQGADARRR